MAFCRKFRITELFTIKWESAPKFCPNDGFQVTLKISGFWHFLTVSRAWFSYKGRNGLFAPYVTLLLFTQTYLHSQSGFKIFKIFSKNSWYSNHQKSQNFSFWIF